MGLGLAYAGSHRSDVLDCLLPHVTDENVTMEIASLASLALGFVFVGSENGEITAAILQVLMEKFDRDDNSLNEKWARFMALGLGLVYLGKLVSFALSCASYVFFLQAFKTRQMRRSKPSKPLTIPSQRRLRFSLRPVLFLEPGMCSRFKGCSINAMSTLILAKRRMKVKRARKRMIRRMKTKRSQRRSAMIHSNLSLLLPSPSLPWARISAPRCHCANSTIL